MAPHTQTALTPVTTGGRSMSISTPENAALSASGTAEESVEYIYEYEEYEEEDEQEDEGEYETEEEDEDEGDDEEDEDEDTGPIDPLKSDERMWWQFHDVTEAVGAGVEMPFDPHYSPFISKANLSGPSVSATVTSSNTVEVSASKTAGTDGVRSSRTGSRLEPSRTPQQLHSGQTDADEEEDDEEAELIMKQRSPPAPPLEQEQREQRPLTASAVRTTSTLSSSQTSQTLFATATASPASASPTCAAPVATAKARTGLPPMAPKTTTTTTTTPSDARAIKRPTAPFATGPTGDALHDRHRSSSADDRPSFYERILSQGSSASGAGRESGASTLVTQSSSDTHQAATASTLNESKGTADSPIARRTTNRDGQLGGSLPLLTRSAPSHDATAATKAVEPQSSVSKAHDATHSALPAAAASSEGRDLLTWMTPTYQEALHGEMAKQMYALHGDSSASTLEMSGRHGRPGASGLGPLSDVSGGQLAVKSHLSAAAYRSGGGTRRCTVPERDRAGAGGESASPPLTSSMTALPDAQEGRPRYAELVACTNATASKVTLTPTRPQARRRSPLVAPADTAKLATESGSDPKQRPSAVAATGVALSPLVLTNSGGGLRARESSATRRRHTRAQHVQETVERVMQEHHDEVQRLREEIVPVRFEVKSTVAGDVVETDVLAGHRYWNQEDPHLCQRAPVASAILDAYEDHEADMYRLHSRRYRQLVLDAAQDVGGAMGDAILDSYLTTIPSRCPPEYLGDAAGSVDIVAAPAPWLMEPKHRKMFYTSHVNYDDLFAEQDALLQKTTPPNV